MTTGCATCDTAACRAGMLATTTRPGVQTAVKRAERSTQAVADGSGRMKCGKFRAAVGYSGSRRGGLGSGSGLAGVTCMMSDGEWGKSGRGEPVARRGHSEGDPWLGACVTGGGGDGVMVTLIRDGNGRGAIGPCVRLIRVSRDLPRQAVIALEARLKQANHWLVAPFYTIVMKEGRGRISIAVSYLFQTNTDISLELLNVAYIACIAGRETISGNYKSER